MNWDSIGFDWNQARAFLATAEEGSLSAAARALGLTQPTLGRQVAGLEEALGVVLFERVGRSVVLTGTGRELLDHFRTMGEGAQRVALAATGQSQSIEGRVSITATDLMSMYFLPPVVQEIHRIAPKLHVEIVAANDLRDLQRREADIALRHVRPDQPDLIARLIRESSAHLFGATAYFERYGRPETFSDLAGHRFVSFGDVPRIVEFLNGIGVPVGAENFRTGSQSGIVAWEMVRQGHGLSFMVRDVALATPGIEQILPDLPETPVPVWLTTHRELQTARRIRLVYDILAEALSRRVPGPRLRAEPDVPISA